MVSNDCIFCVIIVIITSIIIFIKNIGTLHGTHGHLTDKIPKKPTK